MQPCLWTEFILESPWKRVLWVLENPGIWSLQVLESPGKQFFTVCTNPVLLSASIQNNCFRIVFIQTKLLAHNGQTYKTTLITFSMHTYTVYCWLSYLYESHLKIVSVFLKFCARLQNKHNTSNGITKKTVHKEMTHNVGKHLQWCQNSTNNDEITKGTQLLWCTQYCIYKYR